MTAQTLSGPKSHHYYSQRLRLHYNDWGNEGAPLLLLIHGGMDHSRSWDWVAQRLKRDWHIVCPDLRGHGDSQWARSGNYAAEAFVYDIAQLVHQLDKGPVSIIAHSWGANVSLRFAGAYPQAVRKLVAIEGIGLEVPPFSPLSQTQPDERLRNWIEALRDLSSRRPRRYPTLAEAESRMKEQNGFLSDEQARHLTIHGAVRNEDGSYSWKFDNYNRQLTPNFFSVEEVYRLWANITCPVLHAWGNKSFAGNPADLGLLAHFQDASLARFENAGHWLHHDQFERFIEVMEEFL